MSELPVVHGHYRQGNGLTEDEMIVTVGHWPKHDGGYPLLMDAPGKERHGRRTWPDAPGPGIGP